MADVFISYAHEGDPLAPRIADALGDAGYDVWWDNKLLPHAPFSQSIEAEVRAAGAVLVIWSARAVASQWVRAEADLARNLGKLVQVFAEPCSLPLPFNQIQAADLEGWDGDPADPRWSRVLASVALLTGNEGSHATTPPASERLRPAANASRVPPLGRMRFRSLAGAALIVFLASGLWLSRAAWVGAPRATRIAVIPFSPIGEDVRLRDFAASLSDDLQEVLSNDQLQMVPQSEVQGLRGADADARAAKLGVGLLMNGTVQSDGKTLTVRVHVDDPAQHVALWSAELSGPATQPAALQAQVGARTVAVLNCSAQALRPKGGIADAAVMGTFLHACDLAETSEHGADDDKVAYAMLDAMRDVAREAPDFAPGHSDLAKHIAFLLPGLPPDETSGLRQEAEREARRALQLDPKDPDAFVALGLLAPPRDYSQRDRLFRLALAADPSWPHANGFLGNVMTSLGRLDEALALYQRAASVNPQSMDWAGVAAQGLVWDGQTREADIELAHLSDLWPGNPEVWEVQLSSDLAQRRWADALAHISGADPAERASVPLARLVPELAALSTHDPAAMASARQRDLELGRTDPRGAIIGLAFLGFADDAFDIAQHYSPDFDQDPEFLFSPLTAILRNDPRFMALAAKFGLPAYWRRTRKWPDFCSEPKLSYDCAAQARGL